MTTLAGPRQARLAVTEIFGPTFSGEGASLGQRCAFIRLTGCNLTCNFCDTAYTWDTHRHDVAGQSTPMNATDIMDKIHTMGVNGVVITGGEPLLQQNKTAWIELLERLRNGGYWIEIETNGTQAPTWATRAVVTRLNVSPKLAHAGDPPERRINAATLADLNSTGKSIFKFVCTTPADLDEVATIAAYAQIPDHRIWIMPEGTTTEQITTRAKTLAAPVLEAGWNMTTRLHVILWGDERGH